MNQPLTEIEFFKGDEVNLDTVTGRKKAFVLGFKAGNGSPDDKRIFYRLRVMTKPIYTLETTGVAIPESKYFKKGVSVKTPPTV